MSDNVEFSEYILIDQMWATVSISVGSHLYFEFLYFMKAEDVS